jgi:hypothetical protein
MDGKKQTKFSVQRDQIMDKVADILTRNIRNNDRRPLVMQAGTGSGKSSTFLYKLYAKNQNMRVICS